ncbi:MAG: radical SAM protein [Candidatus Sericytochromatia bacterium]
MTSEIVNRNFLEWFKSKKENDYWLISDIPNNYALINYKKNYSLLKSQELKCKQITWFVTNKCNLSCIHCGVSANERKFNDISIQHFENIIPDLKDIGVNYITLTGGEPLIRKDIIEIINLLKNNNFKVGMVSNGTYIEKLKSLKLENMIDAISISIDGLEQNHSHIRKSSKNFKQTIDAIKISKNLGVKIVSIPTCVYPQNINELDALKELIFSQGADQWVLRPVSPSGRAGYKKEYEMSYKQIKDLLIYVKKNIELGYEVTVGSDLGYLGKLDSDIYLSPFFIPIGWNSMSLLPNGDIKGFDEEHLPTEGNIFKDNIKDIWLNKFQYFRNPELPEECITCRYFPRCRGGNLVTAELNRRCIKPVLEMLEND